MSNTITIRLTPDRERLLKLFKHQHNVKTNSEAFELALRLGAAEDQDYKKKLSKVAGCLAKDSRQDAVEMVRALREE